MQRKNTGTIGTTNRKGNIHKTDETAGTDETGAQRSLFALGLVLMIALGGVLAAGCFDDTGDDDDEDEIKLPGGNPPAWTVNIRGLVDDFSLTIAEMIGDRGRLIREDTSMVKKTGTVVNHTHIGIDIYELLEEHNLKWSAGTISFEATDGYAPSTSIYNIGPYYEELGIDDTTHAMLVFVEDGQWIAEDDGGPVRVVMPGFPSKYWVGNLVNITVEPWSFRVTGAVNDSREFSVDELTAENGYNMSEFEVYGKGTHGDTHARFYGAPLREVLNRTNPWENASQVIVRSVDEYEVVFNISGVMDNPESRNPMILAIKKDGTYMDVEDGLLQLIVPDDRYDDGDDHPDWFKNKWSMWISEIELLAG